MFWLQIGPTRAQPFSVKHFGAVSHKIIPKLSTLCMHVTLKNSDNMSETEPLPLPPFRESFTDRPVARIARSALVGDKNEVTGSEEGVKINLSGQCPKSGHAN